MTRRLPEGAEEQTNFTRHLRNPQLLATFAVGFNVLFTLVATFTYVTFYLAAPPFGLSPAQLSALFMVYLVGLLITPFGGIWISRVGSRAALIASVMAGIAGSPADSDSESAGDSAWPGDVLVRSLRLPVGVHQLHSARSAVRWPRLRRRTLCDVLLHRRQRSRSPAGNVVALRPVEGLRCADCFRATGNRSDRRRNLEGQGSLIRVHRGTARTVTAEAQGAARSLPGNGSHAKQISHANLRRSRFGLPDQLAQLLRSVGLPHRR